MLFPIPGSLLEGVCELQHAPVVVVSPDDLHADRQALTGEPAGYRDGRTSRGRDVVARPHPVDVGVHLDAVDLSDVFRLDVERRDLADGQRQELVIRQELTKPMIEFCSFSFGAAAGFAGKAVLTQDDGAFVIDGLSPGQHVTMLGPMEISNEVLDRCDVKISQGGAGLNMTGKGIEQGIGHSPMAWIAGSEEERKRLPPKQESFNFIVDFPDFGELINDPSLGRTDDDQITFYHNMGNQGLQFSSVGGLVYEKAREARVGRQVPTEWFLQDIRD